MYTNYIRFTRIVLISVFFVIIAGSVVRMTQSGMGCPDWPRCFGSWIPPLRADQLPPDYEKYLSKQDIDHSFNPYHTWIEYINRLTTAVLGILILVHLIWSFVLFFRKQPRIFWLSLLLLAATGFQAWLGKRVVDANLETVKITTHMIAALFLAAIPVYIIHLLNHDNYSGNKNLKRIIIATLLLLIFQTAVGTDVREQIDIISKSLAYTQRELWIAGLDVSFTVHQLTAFLTAALCIFISFRSYTYSKLQSYSVAMFLLTLGCILPGMIMAYFQIPALAQPLHLLMSCMLTITLFGLSLKVR